MRAAPNASVCGVCAGTVHERSHLPEGLSLELVFICRNQILALPQPQEGGGAKRGGRSKPRDAAVHKEPRSKAAKAAGPKRAPRLPAQCACSLSLSLLHAMQNREVIYLELAL